MLVAEWGHGPQVQEIDEAELDALLDRLGSEASREQKPQNVQVTVADAGTLGIVVGGDWSVLTYVPTDLNPPYMVSVGSQPDDDPVVFYVAGSHYTEALRRNTISTDAARDAMRHFVATGRLARAVTWEQV